MKFIFLYFQFPHYPLSQEQEDLLEAAQKLSYEAMHASVYDFAVDAQGEVFYKGEPFPLKDFYIIPRPNILSNLEEELSLWPLFEAHSKGILLKSASIVLCKNKMKSQLLMESIGIPTPKTLLFYGIPPAGTLQSLPPAPWILKTVHGSLGSGVLKIQDYHSLKSTIQAIAPVDSPPFVLQEFIHEAQACDRRLLMLGEECLVAMERQAQKGEFRANAELGASVKAYAPSQQELDIARQIMKLFSLEFAGIDMIPSAKGPLVLEVNCNPGFKTIQTLCDFSIAERLLDYCSMQ